MKKVITSEALSRNLPPPTETFAADTMAQLRALAAAEEAPVMKRKVWQTMLIAALLLALLAATALAITTLRRSADAARLTVARQALMDAYGLTPETVGLFNYPDDPAQEGETYTYVFTGGGADPKKLGTYTVILSPDADPVVTWSHDGLDPALWQGLPLEAAPAWGQEQMLQVLRDKRAELAQWAETDWGNLTLADKAALGHGFRRMLTLEDSLHLHNVAPEPGDLSEDRAVSLASQAVLATYGLDAETLSAYAVELDLGVPGYEEGPRQYVVHYVREIDAPTDYQDFDVALDAKSGALLGCQWQSPPALRTLPDGPLKGYEQAVSEFLAEGALAFQSAAGKADIVARIRAAGLSSLLPADTPAYVAPGPTDLPEAEALAAAAQALADAYGFTPETLAAFYAAPSAALVAQEDGSRRWVLSYPCTLAEDRELRELADKLGDYEVTLAGDTGAVLDTAWTLADAYDGKTYTRETLAEAPVYPATALPALLDIQRELDALIARNPTYEESHIYDFSLADVAAYYRLTWAAGLPNVNPRRIPSVPGPGHIPQEEALAIAKMALREEMGFSEDALADAAVMTEFVLFDGEPQWQFQIFLVSNGIQQGCGVVLNAETGEVLLTDVTTGGNG